jgi:uncharacterized protein (TIGR03067 family)
MNLVLCVALAVGAPGVKDPPKKDPSIIGAWRFETLTINGVALPNKKGDDADVIMFKADDTYSTVRTSDGKSAETTRGTYKFDAKKTPAEIDITSTPDGKDKPAYGIYKIDGDTLTISTADDARPTKFESVEGGKTSILMTLKRVKKE